MTEWKLLDSSAEYGFGKWRTVAQTRQRCRCFMTRPACNSNQETPVADPPASQDEGGTTVLKQPIAAS